MPRRISIVLLAVVLAACSQTETVDESTSLDDVPDASLPLVNQTQPERTLETDLDADPAENAEDLTAENAEADGEPDTDEVTVEETLAQLPADDRNNTAGTAAPPLTDTGVPAQYTGTLGFFGKDQLLYGAPAPLPTAAPGAAPLTGLSGVPSGPATVVKIDNSSKARPQLGLNAADVVIEEEVEWGITRLAAIFHTNDATVGPVRSGRTTDLSFLSSLGQPALVYSGANNVTDTILRSIPSVQNFSAARTGGYWRDSSRSAPSNMMTSTESFAANGSGPPAWFHFGPNTLTGTPTSTINVVFPNSNARWTWDGAQWLRNQNGSRHTTDGGAQVSAANVVVAVVPRVDTGMVDSAGSVVPEFVWAGSGEAAFFIDGVRVDGTWTRSRLSEPAVFVDTTGEVVEFTPGRTWIELVVAGNYSSS